MVFTNLRVELSDLNISLNGRQLERVESERFLDQNMSWKLHIAKLASKISMNSGTIYKLKGIVPNKILMTLYKYITVLYNRTSTTAHRYGA